MIETILWAIAIVCLGGVVLFGTMLAWGEAPTRGRIMGCLFGAIAAIVLTMMILGTMGMPEQAVQAATPALIAFAAVVVLRARKTHPRAFSNQPPKPL